jgi:hypothetical protein
MKNGLPFGSSVKEGSLGCCALPSVLGARQPRPSVQLCDPC